MQGFDENIQNIPLAIGLDIHAGGGVSHPAFEVETRGEVVNERPEANTLDNTTNVNADTLIGHGVRKYTSFGKKQTASVAGRFVLDQGLDAGPGVG